MNCKRLLAQTGISLKLALINFKDYLYTFRDPDDVKVIIKPYDPHAGEIGKKWQKAIQSVLKDVKVYFVGSTYFKLPGQGDVDLLAGYSPEKFPEIVESLEGLLGKPKKLTSRFVEWTFDEDGVEIDFFLGDPELRIFKEFKQIYLVLKNDKSLLAEYKRLKQSAHNLSIREYERLRKRFFNYAIYRHTNLK